MNIEISFLEIYLKNSKKMKVGANQVGLGDIYKIGKSMRKGCYFAIHQTQIVIVVHCMKTV